MVAECDRANTTWPFDSECFAHQYHIMTRNFCKAVDEVLRKAILIDFRLYGSVAKILHIMRDNAFAFAKVWMDLYPNTAGASIGNVPPKPISGRWGRFGACLEFLLRMNWTEALRVWGIVIGDDDPDHKKRILKPDEMDEMRAEDAAAHSEKLGRWREEATPAITHPFFRTLLWIAYQFLRRQAMFLHALEKYSSRDQVRISIEF